jgi:hypothetical protein
MLSASKDECDPDDSERSLLAALAGALQLPDNDDRGNDLDQRVEPEAGERQLPNLRRKLRPATLS